ncbi:MAG: GAF domain-containing protein [Actinomyces sp.]|nr:GAF domain-containing protein [Actinomyces sp.]MDN6428967.1 GAF domain-containing protein [Propionibacterium sp.]MDN6566090.1 GAF domain-containing protein [Actinomyces sp.]MDN6794946.1 GAF domain-containing protein [Propionibacterium sp.]
MTQSRPDLRLLEAALDLTSNLHLRPALQRFVDQACRLTGARYGALSVLDNWGDTTMFIQHGFSREQIERMGNPPLGHGLIAEIPTEGALIINDVRHSENAAITLPQGHQEIENFLGAPVTVHEQVYGRLYLTDKFGGFGQTDAEVVTSLAAAAGVAVENAELFAQARNRERWIAASQKLTTTMLEGADEEEALVLIAQTVRDVADADTAIIVLPSVGDVYAGEITDGYHADRLLGVVFPPEGRALSVLAEGTGMIVDSMARAQTMRVPELAEFGPALYAPLRSRGQSSGVLVLLRRQGSAEFASSDLPLAESLASQATLALELASARHAEDVANLLDERDRIGRDLHDFAIQQLFGAGMQLDATKQKVASGELDAQGIIASLDDSLASVDEAVRQIRAIVHNLREPDQSVGLVERLRREASLSRNFLGFAPSLVIRVDGEAINAVEDQEASQTEQVEGRIDPDISDDVVAVVREGLSNIARHAHATAGRVIVDVNGHEQHGEVCVRVADDGHGIDPNRTRNSGLGNLQARARRHGGTFTFGVGLEGRGTEITWRVPLAQ